MAHRFFTTTSLATNDILFTDEAHIHQLTHVLRMKVGDMFVLNEGDGEDVHVVITHIHLGKSACMQLQVTDRRKAWVPKYAVHVLLATIRKERYEWALEKCTELGATCILPLTTERSERGAVSHARATKIVREAAEQCGRGTVPGVDDVQRLEDVLPVLQQSGELVIACVHTGAPFSPDMLSSTHVRAGLVTVLIGPEGGWTPHELALFKKHGVLEVSLGPTNLRAETAAVTICALIHTQKEV